MISREDLKDKKRIVVKIGSSSLTHEKTGRINLRKMELLVRQLSDVKNSGKDVILVSSGAIAVGKSSLKIDDTLVAIANKQAAAAVGQASLIMKYQRLFKMYEHDVAQILLTKIILDHDTTRRNAVHTFEALLNYGIIPIVNENDTISTEEIEFGDNDTLSALVAEIANADLLIILSDIDGLYDDNPNLNKDAKMIQEVKGLDASIYDMAGDTHSDVGTGGMVTKLNAAKIANDAGIDMVIANANKPHVINRIIDGEDIGTIFRA